MNDIFNFGYRFKKPVKRTLKKVKFKEVAIPKMPHTKRMSRVTTMASNKVPLPRNKRSTTKLLRMTGIKKSGVYNVIAKSKNIGMNRINQQKGLKPLGDFDHDGLINMLDCNPRNFFEQGPSHTVETKLHDGTYVPEGDTGEYKEPVASAKPTDAEILRQRREQADIIRAKAREKARADYEKKRVKDLAKMYVAKQSQANSLTSREKALRKTDAVLSAPAQGISAFSRAVTSGATGVGGFGINQAKLVPTTQGMSKANKLRVFLGKEPIPEQTATAVPEQPTQAQPAPQGGVVSPYSKRRVSYVRGPYKK